MSSEVYSKEKHMFSTDRPIIDASQDQLNRAKFSEELANSIKNWTEKDSLVLAVYGQWGDGKSSVKNLVKEVLINSNQGKAPLLIEFNPWQWAGDDHITEAFFKEIASKLSQSENAKEQIVAEKLIAYSEFLELNNELIVKLKTSIERIIITGVGGAGILSAIANGRIQLFFIGAVALLSLASFLVDEIIWLLKWFAKRRGRTLKVQKTLEDRKNELIKSLNELPNTVIVILDDIDRLSKDEIKTLFKIIKANGDFPNIVYLTFFQRDIVEKSLDEKGVYEGSEFLKKIVQVGFNLPKVPIADIHKILHKELDHLLDVSKLDKKFDQARWNELFLEGMQYYFKNLRDVNRFISTFSFHLGIFKKNNCYEVNFVDLIGVEVLRQFEPKVYESIFFAKSLLTGSSGGYHSFSKEEHQKQMAQILKLATNDNEDYVKAILKVLFPNAQWTWGANTYSEVGDEAAVKLRINHEDFFNRYFSLFLPDEEIPQSDLEYALSLTNDEEKLFSFFMMYFDQGRLDSFMKKFEAYKQVVPKDHAVPFISAILRVGDFLTSKDEGFFTISPLTNARRIIHWYFKKQDFGADKQEIFWNILKESKGIYLPIDFLFDEFERRNPQKYSDSYIFLSMDVEKIRKLLIEKISQNKDSEAFRNSMHLPRILHAWKKVDSENEEEWFLNYIENDLRLINFLAMLESRSSRSSGYEQKVTYNISLSWLGIFFNDIQLLLERLKTLKENGSLDTENSKKVFSHIENIEDQFLHPDKYKNGFKDDD